MLNIAHRGNSAVAPENTLAAFESAARGGAQMIETDIHVCASGEIVVIHDDDVATTTNGTGQVMKLPWAALKNLDAGSWFSPAFAQQRIPLLADLLEFYQHHPKLELLLEFKGDWPLVEVARAVAQVEGAQLRERTILESFSVITMTNLAEIAPGFRRGLLVDDFPSGTPPEQRSRELVEKIIEARRLGVHFLNPSVELVKAHPELVARSHQAKLEVHVWTADHPADFAHLSALRVDGICTNRPGFLAGWLAGRQPS